jgi:5-methylcytosine-specific restriction endonuclease McrA
MARLRGFLRICPTPGCPEMTAGGLCPACEAKRQARIDAKRPSAAARGYDQNWRRIRARYLRAHPSCETPGCFATATEIDHLDGRGPLGDNSDGNLMALCSTCHSRKTVHRDWGFGRQPTGA